MNPNFYERSKEFIPFIESSVYFPFGTYSRRKLNELSCLSTKGKVYYKSVGC